jgi:hypothetical protein
MKCSSSEGASEDAPYIASEDAPYVASEVAFYIASEDPRA